MGSKPFDKRSIRKNTEIVVGGGTGERLTEVIRGWIERGGLMKGENLPSERKLAEHFQVTRKTVRRVLEGLEGEGLIRTVGRKRVVCVEPAGRDEPIMAATVVVLSDTPPRVALRRLSPGQLMMIETGAIQSIREYDSNAMVVHPNRLTGRSLRQFIEQRPRGVIAFRDTRTLQAELDQLIRIRDAGLPMVVYGYGDELASFNTVESDQENGSYELTRHLINRGCRRILRYWELHHSSGDHPVWLKDRDAGYLRAIREAGLEVLPAIRAKELPFIPASIEEYHMRVQYTSGLLGKAIRRHGPFDAVMAVSDGVAFPVTSACREMGMNPGKDVVITGYDNYWDMESAIGWEPCGPAATVDKCNEQIGHAMVELLMVIEKEDVLIGEKHHIRLKPELIVIEAG